MRLRIGGRDLLRFGVTAAVAAGIAILPFYLSNYHVGQGARVAVFFIAILSQNVVTGYAGQISIGQGAFMLVGGYTTGILVDRHGWNIVATLPIVFLLSFAIGALLGLPALRLSGVYLALATFAFAFAMPQLPLKFTRFFAGKDPESGGANGFQFATRSNLWIYGAAWTCAAILFLAMWWILRGRIGRAFRAVRDSEVAATSSGVNLAIYKVLAFAISGGIAGIAGTMFVLASNSFVGPLAFTVFLSLRILVGSAVAGLGSLWGMLAGAAFIALLPDISESTPVIGSSHGQDIVYGAVVILLMFVLPGGVAGLGRQLVGIFVRLRGRKPHAHSGTVEAA